MGLNEAKLSVIGELKVKTWPVKFTVLVLVLADHSDQSRMECTFLFCLAGRPCARYYRDFAGFLIAEHNLEARGLHPFNGVEWKRQVR